VAGDRRVWTIGVVLLLLTPFDEPFLGFAIAFLEQERGHSPAVATLLGGAATIGGVAGAAVAGRVGRRLGTRTALAGAGIVAAGVVLVAVSPWAALQAMGAATVGIGLYVVWVDLQARMLTIRPGQAGATGSLVDAISEVGAALPLAIGHLADRAGLPAAVARTTKRPHPKTQEAAFLVALTAFPAFRTSAFGGATFERVRSPPVPSGAST